jgi:signal transduction histidine kinase
MAGKPLTEGVTPGEHMVALAKDLGSDPGADPEVGVVADGAVGRALRRSMAVVEDDAGRVVGTYSAMPDAMKFKETMRLQEEFLSRVTHDLQAPLASISCALELLSERASKLGGDEANFLDVCVRNSQQLGSMIRDILDFSKLQSGKMAIRTAPASMTDILTEAVTSLQPWAKNKKIRLLCRAPQPDLLVLADHQRIVQVFTNLISNAIKFTPEGGSIVATAAPNGDQDGRVVCAVRDTGRGVPKASLEKIFEKFAQAENHDGAQSGVGLGLSIVSEFVKLHGGKVWAESEVGKGSTFYFTLPAQQAQG